MNDIYAVVATSLQWFPEEFSPDTPVDAYRIGNRTYEILCDWYGAEHVDLLNRDDYGGDDDCFVRLLHDINERNPLCAVHIHQDACSSGGTLICYYKSLEFALMARPFFEALEELNINYRGLQKRVPGVNGVYVLTNANHDAILTENGDYTHWQDEAIGIEPYAQANAKSVAAWLEKKYGIKPKRKDDDVMISNLQIKPKQGSLFVWVAPDVFTELPAPFGEYLCYLNIYNESEADAKVYIFGVPTFAPVEKTMKKQSKLSLDVKAINGGNKFVGSIIVKSDNEGVTPVITTLSL